MFCWFPYARFHVLRLQQQYTNWSSHHDYYLQALRHSNKPRYQLSFDKGQQLTGSCNWLAPAFNYRLDLDRVVNAVMVYQTLISSIESNYLWFLLLLHWSSPWQEACFLFSSPCLETTPIFENKVAYKVVSTVHEKSGHLVAGYCYQFLAVLIIHGNVTMISFLND